MRAAANTPAEPASALMTLASRPMAAFPVLPPGRLPHYPFRGLHSVHHVPARTVAEPPKAALCHQSASAHFVASVNRPGCYQPERQLLDGIRTRQKEAPFHGAR